MNLILQAIKSMFLKLTRKVDKNTEQITEHTASINGLQDGMETVQATADKAQATADKAQATADKAQAAVEELKIFKIKATVTDYTATVTNVDTLVDGMLYFIDMTGTTNSTKYAYINCGGSNHFVYVGINPLDISTMKQPQAKNVLGVYHSPMIALFSGGKFYILSKTSFNDPVPCNAYQNSSVDSVMYYYGTRNQSNNPERYRYMRVKSSTPGSTKAFDIQVDDSGTITAVEVT